MPFYTRGLSIHEFEYIWGSWRASLVTLLVKNPPAMQETLVRFLGWEDPLDKGLLPTPVFMGFSGARGGVPGGSDGKESTCSAGDLGLIPESGRSPGGGHSDPLQLSLPGESPWTEEPGGLQSMELQRVGHDWATKHSTAHRVLELIPHRHTGMTVIGDNASQEINSRIRGAECAASCRMWISVNVVLEEQHGEVRAGHTAIWAEDTAHTQLWCRLIHLMDLRNQGGQPGLGQSKGW